MPTPGDDERPVLLVGAQRSGTTALASCLSAAFARRGGTFTVNGKLLYFLSRWMRPDDLHGRHLRTDEMLHALRRRSVWGVGAEQWLERAESALRTAAAEVAAGHWEPTPEAALRLARRTVTQAYAGTAWGDKYNEYLLDLPWLFSVYPRARWVFVYRRPAEVVRSVLEWHGDRPWNPSTVIDAESKWMAWNAQWLEFRELPAPEDVVELDYDEVCSGRAGDALQRLLGDDVSDDLTGLSRRRPPLDVPSLLPEAEAMHRRLAAGRSRAPSIAPVPSEEKVCAS